MLSPDVVFNVAKLGVLVWAALRVVKQLDTLTEKVGTIDGRLSRVEGHIFGED